MKIIRLEIQNFLGIGTAKLALDDKGLVLIQGENLDDPSAESNGAGKSSIADALFWALYGETARGSAADNVVNWVAGKDCKVTVQVEEKPGEGYTITRWRKCKGMGKTSGVSIEHQLTAGSLVEATDLTKGTDRQTQEVIDQALGCSKEVFTAAVYAGQEALPNLPAMTDSELKTLIEQASGVDTLIRAYKIAREKLGETERAHDRWRADHARAERDLSESDTRLADLKARRAGYDAKRKTDLANLANELRERVARAKQAQFKRDEIKPPAVQAKIDLLDIKINAVHEEQEEDSRLNVAVSAASSAHTRVKAIYERAVTDAQAQKRKLDAITEQVGTPCSECGKPHTAADIEGVKVIAHDRLKTMVASARELGEDMRGQEALVEQARQKLTEHRSKRTDIRSTVEERRRLAELLTVRMRADDACRSETEAASRVKAQIDRLKIEVNPFIEVAERGEQELNECARALRELEEAGVALEERLQVGKDVVKVFGPAGVRAHILDNVTPYLNDRTADYLGTLSDGKINAVWSTLSLNAKGELAEKFAINVTMDGRGAFADLSGGQKRKVRLACALALQDLVASRASKPVGLWIGDEIDDALDDAGLERLMTVLETKARERGTVLVISHNSLNDWIRDTVTVKMKGGQSTVEGCLVPA